MNSKPENDDWKDEGIVNITKMVREWLKNVEKGEDGEDAVRAFLIAKGYQVNIITPWNYEKTETTLGDDHKEETMFSPDFLCCGKNEIFLADSKGKSKAFFLGWINKTDYDKYWNTMSRIEGIGFKIYFPIKETGEMWVLEKIVEPSNFPTRLVRKDNRLCYMIPKEHLKLCD